MGTDLPRLVGIVSEPRGTGGGREAPTHQTLPRRRLQDQLDCSSRKKAGAELGRGRTASLLPEGGPRSPWVSFPTHFCLPRRYLLPSANPPE